MILSQLIGQLAQAGGAIVMSNECSEMEIADAAATSRFAVDDEGYGYVLRSKEWLELQKTRELSHRDKPAAAKDERIAELTDLLTSARCIAQRKGADTAWHRFDFQLAEAGIGSVTAKVFKVLPSDV